MEFHNPCDITVSPVTGCVNIHLSLYERLYVVDKLQYFE